MTEIKCDPGNYDKSRPAVLDAIEAIMNTGGSAIVTVVNENVHTGKWGMTRIWYAWIADVAKFMAGNGVTQPLYIDSKGIHQGSRPFNKDDAHYLFTVKCLGQDSQGNRLSWAKKAHDGMIPADRGQRLIAMTKLHEWATERGIRLYNPKDGEYQQLLDRQCQ